MAGVAQEAVAKVEEAGVAVAAEAEELAVVEWARVWLEEAGMVKVVGREEAEILEWEAGPVEEKREAGVVGEEMEVERTAVVEGDGEEEAWGKEVKAQKE